MVAPKLRFDGFDSDWTLDSIGAVISNKSKKYDPEKSEIDFPCIELEHLSQQTGEILGTVSAKDQKSIKNVFDENSVLFGKLRPYLRKFAKPEFQGVCSSEIWVLTSKKMQPNFLFQYVQTDGFSELTQIQAGSKMPRADWGSISNGEILFPIFEEQTKIASFLSAVDEKINQLTQKHQLLSQYKQGMMQKLFSQQIRFKADDGSEFDEWKSIQLKDFLTFTPRPVDKPEIAYHALGVRSHFKGLFNKYDSEPQKISMDTLYTVEKDDVVVNITFAWEGAMAIAKDEHNQGLVSHRFPTYKCNESKVNLIFFNYRFIQKDFLSHLQLCSPGGAGRNRVLNKQSFLEISFEKPCVQEQTKIANFLSAIDQKIEVTAQQIEQAKQWKKGLLQQMFV